MSRDTGDTDSVRQSVRSQYNQFPYPAPDLSLDSYINSGACQFGCPSRFFHWYWPRLEQHDNLDVLVAGCGTSQAVKFALSLPGARVTGVDLSETSIEHSRQLAQRHGVTNLELHQAPIEDAHRLGKDYDLVVSTGVLHHLPSPQAGLAALRDVCRPGASLFLMLYGKHGRTGVYAMQEFFRILGLRGDTASADDVVFVREVIKSLPAHHPVKSLGICNPATTDDAELVDLFLHPQDRGYSIPDVYELLDNCQLKMQRLLFRAHYLPAASALANPLTLPRIEQLALRDQYALNELFHHTSRVHFFVACKDDRPETDCNVELFDTPAAALIPVRNPALVIDNANAPPGAAALARLPRPYFPELRVGLDATEMNLLNQADGNRSLADILPGVGLAPASLSKLDRLELAWFRARER